LSAWAGFHAAWELVAPIASIAALSAATVMQFGAVALFVALATAVDKLFTLPNDTAPICRRLATFLYVYS